MKMPLAQFYIQLTERQKNFFIGGIVFLTAVCLYLSTWHGTFGGYEQETMEASRNLLSGTYEVRRAGIGAYLLYMPFIIIGSLLFHDNLYTLTTLVPTFYTALGLVFLFLTSVTLSKQRTLSFWVTILIGFATDIWVYTNLGMEYQLFFLISVLSYLIAIRGSNSKISSDILLGAIVAFTAATKSYGVLLVVPVVLAIVVGSGQSRKTLWKSGTVISFLAVAGFFLSLSVGYATTDSWTGAYSLAHEFQMTSWWEGVYGSLFSFGKGILIYNPLLIVAVLYWKKAWRSFPSVATFIVSSFVVLFLLTAPFRYWSDETWAVRKLVPIIPLLHLPLLVFLAEQKKSRVRMLGAGILAVLAVYIHFLGAIYTYGKHLAVVHDLNVDTIEQMRYTPATSNLVVFHHLFMTYLTNDDRVFSYTETTWFRWTRKESDIPLHSGNTDLSRYAHPDTFLLRHAL